MNLHFATRQDRAVLWQLFSQAIIDQIEAEQAAGVTEMDSMGLAVELPSPLRVIAFRSVHNLTHAVKELRQPGDVDMDDHAIAYELRHEALRLCRGT
jgi:hypothetical protein